MVPLEGTLPSRPAGDKTIAGFTPCTSSESRGAPARAQLGTQATRAPSTARVHHVGTSQLSSPNLILWFQAQYPHPEQFYPWHLYHCLANLVSGAFAEGLVQYGAGPGHYAGFAEPAFPSGAVTTDQLAGWLDRALVRVNPLTQALYMLFPGPATQLGESGFQYGADFCAYHSVTPGGIPYAVMPFPVEGVRGTCGQTLGLSALDILTLLSSHELAEAMTDTVPGQGEDGPEGEIDDFAPCLWNPVAISFDGWRYTIQAYWDEAAGACWSPGLASARGVSLSAISDQPGSPGSLPLVPSAISY